jgi:hypothetical protein
LLPKLDDEMTCHQTSVCCFEILSVPEESGLHSWADAWGDQATISSKAVVAMSFFMA